MRERIKSDLEKNGIYETHMHDAKSLPEYCEHEIFAHAL